MPLFRRIATVVGLLALSAVAYGFAVQSNRAMVIACQSNLKQMSLGMLMYTQDYDERYPPTKTAAHVQNRILPYVKERKIFSCPDTGLAYLPNPALNYVNMGTISSPATMMMLRDDKPHKADDGTPGWNIAYADGHVKLSLTEIPLGKLAPEESPAHRLQQELKGLKYELATMPQRKKMLQNRIRQIEAEQRRLGKKK